ncbi:MAG: adenylate/guanylate cyclase domain-containing protein [Deltaproteobacteria bacterium]|nr:adenylate/guanylate cyclase domain-containing protein [Deltaproteobacteria bacterium]
MSLAWTSVLIALGVTTGLAFLLHRKSREAKALRERLESATTDLEHLQRSFGRFAPEEIVERVIARGISTGGERKEVTALFADLVGYTALSERLDPDVLLRILNGYFERMSRAITEHRGHVSALIGDGMLALFGALEPDPWQANGAVRAALAMRDELEAYNHTLEADGLPPLAIGIGLHRGVGVAGLVGSRDLIQYAFVGRTINVAARVQDLTRNYDADILVTRELQQSLDPRFRLREFPPADIRGIAEPVGIYAVDGLEP